MPEQSEQQPQADSEESQAPVLPENTVAVEEAGPLKKRITITVPRAKIDAKYGEMFGELGRTAQVPGFRIGHAPRRLIEKRFGKEIAQDVRNAMVADAIAPAIQKAEIKTLGEPEIDLEAITLPDSGDLSFSFQVEVMPKFELPSLDGIKVRKQTIELTPRRIDEYVEQLRRSRARFEATDGPAAEGDAVLAGATISGEGLAPLERHGLNLRVAPGQIEGLPLVDLGKALAGKKAGEKVSLTVKAGEAHPNKDWHGKELAVALEISQVRRRILPEANEEFAKSMGFDSLVDLRKYVTDRMKWRIKAEVQQSMRDQVCRYLLDRTQLDLPEGAAARYTERVLQRRFVDLLYRGVSAEQINARMTELRAAAGEQARQDMKLSFILNKIAEQQEVKVEDGEVNARIAQMAAEQNRRPERLRQELAQDGSLSALEDSLREAKVLDNVLAKADITEVAEAPAAEQPKKKPAAAASAKKGRAKAAKKPAKKPAKKKSSGK